MELDSLTIRPYQPDDFPAASHLYEEVGWSAYTDEPEVLRASLESSSVVLLAIYESSISGLIRVITDHHTICYIQDILVKPSLHRSGIGTSLMNEILNRFGHLRQIVLLTDDDEGQANFYTSMGFSEVKGKLRSYARLS